MASRKTVYGLFALVAIGAALGNLSQTGLNAMLPQVMTDLHVEVELGQWLTTGYMLVLGVIVPVSTFLSRKVNDKSYLLIGFGLFAFGSFIDWIAPEFFSMLFGRILQAAAVGLLIPFMQDIAMMRFPEGQQATAMGIAGIALGFAPNIGPTVGGALDSSFGWRSFFLLLLGLTLLLFIITLLFVKRTIPADSSARFESISFAFSTLGFGGILLGLSQASSFGFGSLWFWAPVVVGIVFIVLFVRRQQRISVPLINMSIFRSKHYNEGITASIFLFACYMGVTLVIPLYAQDILEWSSLDAGLVMFPATITALIVNPLSGWLADKTSVRFVSLFFGAFLAVGSVACVFVGENTTFIELTIYQTIRSIGVSGLIGPLITYSLGGLEGSLIPHGSSASVIIRQVAATFGTAIMVLCISIGETLVLDAGFSVAFPYQSAFAFSALMGLISFAVIVFTVKDSKHP